MSDLPAWLQATAAVAQLGFGYAMFRITRDYVRATKENVQATKDIAVSTAAQVELLRAGQSKDSKQEGAFAEVAQRVAILRDSLESLPSPGAQAAADRLMRSATLPADQDLEGLTVSAARLGAATAETAARAVQDLRWLRDRALEVRSVTPMQGYSWQDFRWDRWAAHYVGAKNALETLRAKP